MSEDFQQKCIGLVTNQGKPVLNEKLAEYVGYALSDLCQEKGWGKVAHTVEDNRITALMAFPKDLQGGLVMKAMKDAIAKKVFEQDPELKAALRSQLWSNSSVIMPSEDNVARKFERRMDQAVDFAQSRGPAPTLQ